MKSQNNASLFPVVRASLSSNHIRDRFVGRLFRLGMSTDRNMKQSSGTRQPAGAGFLRIGAVPQLEVNARRLAGAAHGDFRIAVIRRNLAAPPVLPNFANVA